MSRAKKLEVTRLEAIRVGVADTTRVENFGRKQKIIIVNRFWITYMTRGT
jgi:hypothetical protein